MIFLSFDATVAPVSGETFIGWGRSSEEPIMTVAAILFAIAALGGVIMALIRFSGRPYPPMALAVIHGLFAAAGLIALIMFIFGGSAGLLPKIAVILFVGAAIGGFAMFSYHVKSQPLPISYVVIHGLVAVIAFVLLIVAMMNHA